MAYVYRHIRLDTNMPFYIGIGSDNLYKRANEKSRRSNFWKKIINKTQYEVEILFDNVSIEFAKEKEIEFIKLYGRIDLNNGSLCNLTNGGDGVNGYIFTNEHKQKLSKSAKKRIITEEQKQKLRQYRIGKKLSPYVIECIKKANIGRKRSESEIKKHSDRMKKKNPSFLLKGEKSIHYKGIIIAYRNNEKIGEFIGIYDAAKSLNINASKISAVINGRRNHTCGYIFKRIPK